MNFKLVNTAASGERTFVLVFDSGEDVLGPFGDFVKAQGVRSAAFTGLGALSAATFGWFDLDTQEYEPTELTEQVELLSLVGNVALKEDGSAQIHPHVVVGRRDGAALGGHLLSATVRPTLEITLTEDPATLRRTFRPEYGIALIDPEL